MVSLTLPVEPSIVIQVLTAWWIEIPAAFDATFVHQGVYWHAWDEHRSVSMSSTVLTNELGPGRASDLAALLPELLPALPGASRVDEVPPGLLGRATYGPVPDGEGPARASHVLSGLLAMDGRIAVVTITSDDEAWARRVWMSIRGVPAPIEPRAERRAAARKRGRGLH